ncbi:O-antigen polymerase [Exiguobacterium mexicanum]
MLAMCTLVLLIAFLAPLIAARVKFKDNFHPIVLASFLNLISIVPYLFLLTIGKIQLSEKVTSHYTFTTVEESIFKFTMVYLIGYCSLLAGMMIVSFNKKEKTNIEFLDFKKNNIRIQFFIPMIIIATLGAYLHFLNKIGGLNYLLNNLELRAQMTSGNGYILSAMPLMTLSILLLIYTYWKNSGLFIRMLLSFLVIMNVLIETSLGGRKSTLFIIIFILLISNYSIKKVRFLSPKVVLSIFVGSVYFVTVPILRSSGGFFENISNLGQSMSSSLTNLFLGLSYIDHYVLILNNFNLSNFWLGKSFLDMFFAPIPSFIFPNKPPIDDGMYIRSIAEGWEVTPNSSRLDLFQSSWPPETFGVMYLNFGIVGIILGFFLLGYIYQKMYNAMLSSNYSFFSIYLYGFVVLNFEFSNLRIVQLLTILSVILILYVLTELKFYKRRLI